MTSRIDPRAILVRGVREIPTRSSWFSSYRRWLAGTLVFVSVGRGVARAAQSNIGYVLVVEDDADTREALAAVLQTAGYRVATAADGLDALTHITCARQPAVIILDLHMPEMDGWDLVHELRAGRAGIPIIVTSARNDAGGLRAPFLRKPIDTVRLLELVAEYVSPRAQLPAPG